MVLEGTEVKSLRDRAVSLEEAYVRIENSGLWLIGCHIAAYPYGHTRNHEPLRRRKLLAHRREIDRLLPKVTQRGLTIVPVAMYFSSRGMAKITVALAKGKTLGDKRQALKARDDRREMERTMRTRR